MPRTLHIALVAALGAALLAPSAQETRRTRTRAPRTEPETLETPSPSRTVDGELHLDSDELCLRLTAERTASPSTGLLPVGVIGMRADVREAVIDLPLAPQARATAVQADATAGHTNISALAVGLEATARTTSFESFAYGVRATARGTAAFESVGVDAVASGGDFASVGVRGRSDDPFGLAMHADGDLLVSGFKSFAQPHPEDAGRMIQFCSLEGNESGTYFRGSSRLVGGRAEIPVPEAWRLASEAEGITVQLTPLGPARLWLVERSRERIVVAGDADVEFDYFVNGVRRGCADFEPLRENRAFRPRVRGVPYGQQLPPGLRALLVENGTLLADFTPDEATARALGWSLADEGAVQRQR